MSSVDGKGELKNLNSPFFINRGERTKASMLTNLKIGQSALLVSFIRTKMGREFDVAKKLLERFSGKPQVASYYTCYGQYDLLELLMVDSYEAMYNVPFDKDIVDCEFGLFYSWEDVSLPLHEWAHGYPVLLLVFLKIQPDLEETLRFDIEKSIINFIKKDFIDDANLFAGMGRSEILLLLRGRSFEKLLSNVSQLRQTLTLRKIMNKHLSVSCDPDVPVFIDSTTFLLIAHPALRRRGGYEQLEGKVLPRVNVICNPGFERIVSANKPASCARAFNIYGNYDVVLTWDKKIELAQFAKEITDFRLAVGEIEGINNTLTNFSGKKIIDNDTSLKPPPQLAGFKSEFAPGTEDVVSMLNTLNPNKLDSMIRSRLLEFLGRLNSYYGRREYKSSFRDLLGVIYSILYRLNELKTASGANAISINTALSEIIDLSNNALFQRYADLETRFGTSKHLPFPFLRSINGYIAAATCIPCFIFKSVYPDIPVRQNWTGFVVFGLSYSYQLQRGQILSYPASALQRPIEDWWGITHEVAHAIYRISDFYNQELDEDIKNYSNGFSTKNPMLRLGQEFEEIYANWFDFKYVFAGNKIRYFPTIWKSWLRWERVRHNKFDYLIRSLIIFITTDLEGLANAINQGEVQPYLKIKFNEMKDLIELRVSEFKDFAAVMTENTFIELARYIDKIEPYLRFLEKKYFEQALYDRLNPPYSEDLLNSHIQSLDAGIIVVDNIPNPIKLLHELYDKYPALENPVPLRTNAATILTLWFKYMKDFRE